MCHGSLTIFPPNRQRRLNGSDPRLTLVVRDGSWFYQVVGLGVTVSGTQIKKRENYHH